MDGNTTVNIIKKLGWQVYLTNPYEHMYERLEDMPKANYLNQVRDMARLNEITNYIFICLLKNIRYHHFLFQSYPIFAGLVFLEIVISILKGRSGGRLNEHIMSASHGIMMQAFQ